MATRHRFQVGTESHAVQVDEVGGRTVVRLNDGTPFDIDATTSGVPGLFSIIRDGVPTQAYVTREGKSLRVIVDGRVFYLGPTGAAGRQRGAAGGLSDPPGKVSTPLAGVVVDIRVEVGEAFTARQTLVVVEAMKMQNEVQAPMDGTVTAIKAVQGARMEKGDIVVEYEPAEE
jgi:pyruvate carboxylase subunit B